MDKKAIVLDFDGTITAQDCNVWQECWKTTKFTMDKKHLYGRLYDGFLTKKIDYKTWNYLTCHILRSRNFTKSKLDYISKKIVIKNGMNEFIKSAKQQHYDIFVLSGGIKSCITTALKPFLKELTYISANEFLFDQNGLIEQIVSTKYDNEGKADFINILIKLKNYKKENIIFVGNDYNDEHVCKTGVKTICITPVNTNHQDRSIWTHSIEKVDSMTQLLPYLDNNSSLREEKIEI